MSRPVCAVLLLTTLACQPVDRRSGSADTAGSAPEAGPAPDSAAVVPAAVSPVAAPAARTQPAQLLVPGDHYAGQVNTVTGETWLGLFESDSGWALRATDVTVVAIRNACADTGSQKTARRVGVDQPGRPLFLVRHTPSLEAGAAHAVLTDHVRLYPGERRAFQLGSPAVPWAIAAYGSVPAPTSGMAGDDAIREYALVVSRSPWTTSQSLFTFRAPAGSGGLRQPPTVLWAGDVSGDGHLDVFVDLTAGDLPGPLVLYVSNPGGGPELVQKVAEYQPGRCEPGDERRGSPDGDTLASPSGDTGKRGTGSR
jgi:hypothetical protein